MIITFIISTTIIYDYSWYFDYYCYSIASKKTKTKSSFFPCAPQVPERFAAQSRHQPLQPANATRPRLKGGLLSGFRLIVLCFPIGFLVSVF